MITLNPGEAEDVMNAVIKTALTATAVGTLLGAFGPLVILWEGIEKSAKPDSSKYWIRVAHNTVLSPQSTLSTCEGANGQKRYSTSGLTILQLFGPMADKQVARKALDLATIARNAFRGNNGHSSDDSVWFRNPRINKLSVENDQYRLNVVAEHEYDELG